MATTLMELYSKIMDEFESLTGDEVDTKWFKDIENRRILHRKCPECFGHYDDEKEDPSYPVCDKLGKPNLKSTNSANR